MTNEKLTLTEFLESNHKLFSVLGIFTALTVFSSTIQPIALGMGMSFLFMTATIFVWCVIMNKIPEQKTLPLLVFSYILMFILFGVVAHSFIGYRPVWKDQARTILYLPSALALFFISTRIEKRYSSSKMLRHIYGKGETVSYLILGAPVAALAYVLADFLAMLIETRLLK